MNNLYVRRKVALKDQKPCLICSKPTTTVLYNQSGPDWLYTCDLHLEDNPQFVTPVYSDAYTSVLKELEEVRRELERNEGVKRNGSGSWDTWITKIFDRSGGNDNDADSSSKSNSNSKANNVNTSDTSQQNEQDTKSGNGTTTITTTTTTANSHSLSLLQQRYNALLDKLADLRRQEQNLQDNNTDSSNSNNRYYHRNYKLSDQMFQHRLLRKQQRHQRLLLAKKRQEAATVAAANYSNTDPGELAAKFSFPEVPKSKPV